MVTFHVRALSSFEQDANCRPDFSLRLGLYSACQMTLYWWRIVYGKASAHIGVQLQQSLLVAELVDSTDDGDTMLESDFPAFDV